MRGCGGHGGDALYRAQGYWMIHSGRDTPWLKQSAVQVNGDWNYTEVHWRTPEPVQGTDGSAFQMHMDDRVKKEGLVVWEDDLYRSIKLKFQEEVEEEGVKLWRFDLDDRGEEREMQGQEELDGLMERRGYGVAKRAWGFDRQVEAAVAYKYRHCGKGWGGHDSVLLFSAGSGRDQYYMDTPRGASDLSKPLNGVPAWGSLPHFLGAPYYYDALGGAASNLGPPDPAKHGIDIRVEPQSGMTLNGVKRFQINMMINGNHSSPGDCSWTQNCKDLRQNLLVPVYWQEEAGKASKEDFKTLAKTLRTVSALTDIFPCVAYPFGAVVTCLGMYLLILHRKRTHHWVGWERDQTDDPTLYAPLESS
ncbi:hypothetical protein CYMTET_36006 [Cymbomonas tetramitiformis]|uniref:Uncharacterized protein n=1 Tax=Cymbomonas tetramitiformis TaxID=36881 RepID=A0AAE0KMW8_9CHLO|nr:hypothetical protein CYMTET_36006 [Cymbomonas tetramitiformis]